MNTYFKLLALVVLLLFMFCASHNHKNCLSGRKNIRIETGIQNKPADSSVQSSVFADTCDLEDQAYKFNNQKYINFN